MSLAFTIELFLFSLFCVTFKNRKSGRRHFNRHRIWQQLPRKRIQEYSMIKPIFCVKTRTQNLTRVIFRNALKVIEN